MRILAVVHQFPPDFYSGTEVLCLGTMQELSRRGHDVHVITADRLSGAESSRYFVNGVPVIRIPARESLHLGIVSKLKAELENNALIDELMHQVKRINPDIIHAHHFFDFGLLALLALAKTLPLVFSATDYWMVCPYAVALLPDGDNCIGPGLDGTACVKHHLARPRSNGTKQPTVSRLVCQAIDRISALLGTSTVDGLRRVVTKRLETAREVAAVARAILVASDNVRQMLVAAGIPEQNIELLPHMAPPIQIRDVPVHTPLRIGFLGSLSSQKGAHVLVAAIRALPPDMRVNVIVRGKLSADPHYVRELKSSAAGDWRIQIVDSVPYDRFGEVLSDLDVLVVPSLWAENAPLVLLSAIEAGRYVIVSDMPGLVKVLTDSDHGVVVPAGDANALAYVISRLVADPSPVHRARMRKASAPSFAEYVDAIEIVYRKIATSQVHGRGERS